MLKKVFNRLLVLTPWAVLLGMLQVNFQQFLPYQRIFKGVHFFDYFTVTDIFVSLLLVVFVIGWASKQIKFGERKLPKEIKAAILLLMLAGVLQLLFQVKYEPVLSTPSEYFRGFFIYPILYFVLMTKVADDKTVGNTLTSYVYMVMTFCAVALLQFFSGIFPGDAKDFTGRLTWPYVDFLTLKSSSANWAAFFATPVFILSAAHLLRDVITVKSRRELPREHWLYAAAFPLTGLVIFFTQSYGAFVAIFVASSLLLFRSLKLKKFLAAFVVLALVAGGVYFLQTQTYKYKILSGQIDYRFDNSVASRGDIYRMNAAMILEHPILGVGLNEYQSYFTLKHQQILGHKYGESLIPPHAHNFFMSFWTNLGIFGFLGILVLIAGIFSKFKLKPEYPAQFVMLAIMIHGLIDSYYWRQEIAYTFWIVAAMCYLYRTGKPEKG